MFRKPEGVGLAGALFAAEGISRLLPALRGSQYTRFRLVMSAD
jgi:hypothetical protein